MRESLSIPCRTLFTALLMASFAACSSTTDSSSAADAGKDGDDGTPSGDCTKITNVSDGPTTDETIAAGATVLVCYYAQPSEGYCRKITDTAAIANYVSSQNKGGLGCKDAVILAGPDCPTKNAVGACDKNTIDSKRVYYTCSKFPDPKAHCAQISGTYSAAAP